MLPKWPAARLGTVAHQLMEQVGYGKHGAGREELEQAWEALVETQEQEMAGSWLERNLVPLSESARDCHVRKYRALGRAFEAAQLFEEADATSNGGSAGCGPKHAAKEVKIFVLSDFVTRRYRTLADAIYEDNKDVATRRLGEPLELGAQLRRTHLLAAGALDALRAKMRSTVGIVFHLLGTVFCLKSAEAISRVLDEGPRREHFDLRVARLIVGRIVGEEVGTSLTERCDQVCEVFRVGPPEMRAKRLGGRIRHLAHAAAQDPAELLGRLGDLRPEVAARFLGGSAAREPLDERNLGELQGHLAGAVLGRRSRAGEEHVGVKKHA